MMEGQALSSWHHSLVNRITDDAIGEAVHPGQMGDCVIAHELLLELLWS
jgi:hypothetical protein